MYIFFQKFKQNWTDETSCAVNIRSVGMLLRPKHGLRHKQSTFLPDCELYTYTLSQNTPASWYVRFISICLENMYRTFKFLCNFDTFPLFMLGFFTDYHLTFVMISLDNDLFFESAVWVEFWNSLGLISLSKLCFGRQNLIYKYIMRVEPWLSPCSVSWDFSLLLLCAHFPPAIQGPDWISNVQ